MSKIALRETGLQKHDAYLPFFAASLHAAGASAECVFLNGRDAVRTCLQNEDLQ